MNNFRILIAAMLALAAGIASAQQDISGTWSGNLNVAPGTSVEIHFALTRQPDGSYTTMLTSPDSGAIKDVPANATSFDGAKLMVTVDSLSGSFEGSLANGAFEGNWKQAGQSFPLSLEPYTAPVLTDAAKQELLGSWVGKLSTAGIELAIVFRFENDKDGKFTGYLDSPDQGANGIPIADIQLAGDGQLKLVIPAVRGQYTGTLTQGRMAGNWSQGQSLPLSLEKGEYKAKSTALSLSDEAFAALEGVWRGQLGPLHLVITFETNADGKPSAYLESPDQGNAKIQVTEVTLTDGAFDLKIATVGADYKATLDGTTLTGEWSQPQMPMPQPLTMTKE